MEAARTSRNSEVTPKLSGKGWVCLCTAVGRTNRMERPPSAEAPGRGPASVLASPLPVPPKVLFLISSPPFKAHPASEKGKGDVGQRERHSFPYNPLKSNSQAMCISPRHWQTSLLPVSLVSALLPVAPLSVSDYEERACLPAFCTPQPHQEFIP